MAVLKLNCSKKTNMSRTTKSKKESFIQVNAPKCLKKIYIKTRETNSMRIGKNKI